MQKFDVCVVGAGASGSVCSIQLAKQGKSVCVIDMQDIAKKLLVTGNGRCNITNKNMNSEFYNQNIDCFLSRFGYESTKQLFESYGLDIYADEEGRCYPISNSAKTVQFVLMYQFKKHNISFLKDEVIDVEKQNNQYRLITKCENEIVCDNVVFACGINNFAISIFQKFDIDFKKTCPSLVALKTKQHTKRLFGERLSNVEVTARIGEKTYREFGEVLFKEDGLSGICIFNLSQKFAKNNQFLGKISINLLKKMQKSEIFEKLTAKMNIFESVEDALKSMFSKEVALEILKRANIKNQIPRKSDIENIIHQITNLEFDVCGAYQNNQVQSGGVKLDVLTENLENKKNKGMFFCGEICDVDGICGGYNLQWAFSSANIVANEILSR